MKTVVLGMCLLLSFSSVYSQSKVSGGFVYFPGKSSISSREVSSIDSRAAYQVGPFIQFRDKNDRHAFRVGFLYSHMRTDGVMEAPDIIFPEYPPIYGEKTYYRYTFTDFVIPAEGVLDFNKKPGGLYFVAGPALALSLSHKVVRTPAYTTPDNKTGALIGLWANLGIGYRIKTADRVSIYVQPMMTGNFPSFMLGLLSVKKQDDSNVPAQVTMYGVCFGLAID